MTESSTSEQYKLTLVFGFVLTTVVIVPVVFVRRYLQQGNEFPNLLLVFFISFVYSIMRWAMIQFAEAFLMPIFRNFRFSGAWYKAFPAINVNSAFLLGVIVAVVDIVGLIAVYLLMKNSVGFGLLTDSQTIFAAKLAFLLIVPAILVTLTLCLFSHEDIISQSDEK